MKALELIIANPCTVAFLLVVFFGGVALVISEIRGNSGE